MITPTVYTYDAAGVSTGSQPAVQSPSRMDRPGTWLLPAQSTLTAPPAKIPPGQQAVFSPITKVWTLQKIPPIRL